MKKRTLLIGTTNEGKAKEIRQFLETLPFDIVMLSDLDTLIAEPEETEETIEGNAILKARYYAEQTGLLTLADDSGLFINALDGWPGVHSARIATESDDQCAMVLEKMNGIEDRSAVFRASMALYDPAAKTLFIAAGGTDGAIRSEAVVGGDLRFGYNPIFQVASIDTAYAELTVEQKNSISHRANALIKIKYHLQNTYSGRNIVVPFAVLSNDGKVFMQQRNDPHRPESHMKWEFPGGAVEFGETVEETLVREIKEETGYDIEIIKQLQPICTKSHEGETYRYQIYLIPFYCHLVGGEAQMADAEVMAQQWLDPDKVTSLDLHAGDDGMYELFVEELKEAIALHNA